MFVRGPSGRVEINQRGKTEAWRSHSYSRPGGLGQGNSSGTKRMGPAREIFRR